MERNNRLYTSADSAGLSSGRSLGWEDKLQKQMETLARDEFGIEIDDTVFLG